MTPEDFPAEMPIYDTTEESITWLMGNDYLELYIDEKGEAWFKETEKCKDKFPALAEIIKTESEREVGEGLWVLYEMGHADFSVADGEIVWNLTESGRQAIEESLLDED